MKKTLNKILTVIIVGVYASMLCACIPPMIDGSVEAQDYFDEDVYYNTYTINPNAAEGFSVIAGANLQLNNLTDSNENNIAMQHYYSFTFTAKEDLSLKTIAFVVEVEEAAELSFKLERNALIFNQSVNLSAMEKKIVSFDELNMDVVSSEKVTISIANPLSSNTKYRIDTVIFVI